MRQRGLLSLLVVLTLFGAQEVVQRAQGEPYPALFQPSFGGSVPDGDRAVVQEPTITTTYADGTTTVLSHREVMARAETLKLAVFESAFGPDSPRRDDPESVAWLRGRLTELGDGAQPVTTVIDWRRVTYELSGSRPPTAVSTDRYAIAFGDGAR